MTDRPPEVSAAFARPTRVPWESFVRQFRWDQGDHVLFSGPTHCGKSTLASWLCEQRKYVVILGMKPKDDVLSDMVKRGWQTTARWPAPEADKQGNRRILLWPVTRQADNTPKAKASFEGALRSIFEREGNWTVYVDELYLATNRNWYGLRPHLERMWMQGRSLGISLASSTQRPSGVDAVPAGAYTQQTHMFVFRTPDRRDAERLAEIAGLDRKDTQAQLTTLPRYDFWYRNTREDITLISRCPKRV